MLVQFDAGRNAVYLIQDEGGDVVGAFDLGGAGGGVRMVEQIGYDPYGKVISDYSGFSHAPIHMGHKGLFVDRLDVGVATGGGTENSRLAVGGTALAYARNRTYSPDLGRWMQADPNASGLSLLASASGGRGMRAIPDSMELDGLYSDGSSLYQFVGSNPWMRGDPMGLGWSGGASALDMALLPRMMGILEAVEGRLGAMLIQHYMKVMVAADLAYGALSPDATVPTLFPANIQAIGRFGENMLESLGGEPRVFFRTTAGEARFLDRLVDGIGYEVKTGVQWLTDAIRRQIANDVDIMREGGSEKNPVEKIVWIFFSNQKGQGGCPPDVRQALDEAGITWLEVLSK